MTENGTLDWSFDKNNVKSIFIARRCEIERLGAAIASA